jgi:FkbM family methyltransferase
MEPHEAGFTGQLGKRAAPRLASVANMKPLRSATRLLAIYLDILQGKGSGTGWDLGGEVAAAVAFLEGISEPVILDVGANVGDWTQGIWDALGRGRYFAYEPQQTCVARLKGLNVPGLTIVQSAVSDQSGELDLHSDFAGSGVASFYERSDTYLDPQTHVERVPVTTVDGELEAYGLDRVDFMKIDVEGAELRVLQGAQRALGRHAIRSFAFEFGSANIYSRVFFRDLWDLIAGNGYSLWRIVPGGRLIQQAAYREDLEHFRGVSNYVAAVVTPAQKHKK